MNDSLQPMTSTPDGDNASAGHELTPAEIDARHAKSLAERAFTQLERGERGPAELAVRQAIHLAPRVAAIHSLAGLLALLSGDIETARIGYENAVQDFSKASPERERLIALRMAQADSSGFNSSAFLPSLPNEIARLRALVQATPPEDFLSDPRNPNSAGPRVPYKTETAATTAPSPAVTAPIQNSAEARPAFASRLEQRKRTSAWAVGIAAVSAAIVAFFVMRSLVAPKTAPQAGSTPSANQVVVENPPLAPGDTTNSATQNSATETPALGAAASTPNTETPAPGGADAGSTPSTPTAIVTVKPLPPASTTPVTTPHPAPKPKPTPPPAVIAIPGLPAPAPKPATPSRETPTPTPTPAPRDPNFPPMPPPRVSLPSAGGEKTEFPRVLPDNG